MASLNKDILKSFPQDIADKRLLAHENVFTRVFARNCEVRKIGRDRAAEFLNTYHNLGYTNCRYCYGLFVRREGHTKSVKGQMLAVAGFSSARKWEKDGRVIRSFEWVRYASLPELRIAGGMGKMLKHFIEEMSPDDIMSYADNSWSDGDVYKKLGFTEEEPKLFSNGSKSLKFRLKLTDYQP